MNNDFFRLELKGGIATIWIDSQKEKINIVSPTLIGDFEEVFNEVSNNNDIKGAILISAKKDFIAGADIKSFKGEKRSCWELLLEEEHRELLNGLDEWSENKRKNLSIDEKSRMIINEVINEVHIFRDKHLEYARVYIFEQSLTNNSNSNTVGTGGTPFMKYLDKHLQETVPSND